MAPFSFRISFSLWWCLFFSIILKSCLKGKEFHHVSVLARFVPTISSSNPKILAL